jgi:hypothetical protein
MVEILELEQKTGKATNRLWRDRIDATIRWRKSRRFGDRMFESSRKLFEGQHWSFDADVENFDHLSSDNPNDFITVNVTGSTVQDFLPFLVRTLPKFQLVPGNSAAVESARVASTYFNWAWREYQMHPQYRRAVQDGLVYGTGIVKTGYKFELEAREDASGRVAYNDNVRYDAPHIMRIDPRRFYFDPGAPGFDLESARWAFEVIFQPLQDVIENKLYSEKVRRGLKSGRETPETIADYFVRVDRENHEKEWVEYEGSSSQRLVVLYEVWDKKFDQYWLFLGGVETPLIQDTNPYPYLDGFPYNLWKYQEINDEPLGQGVPEVMKDQQHELNRIRTSEFNHRRKYGQIKWQVLQDGISQDELANMLSADQEYFITQHPQGVTAHMPPPLPRDNYQVDAVIQQDLRQLTGQDELQRGGSLPSRTSAREIQARQSIMGTKTAGRSALVDEFLNKIGRQVLQHIQANIETKKVIRVVDVSKPEGLDWLTMSPEDIRHEFDLEFESTSRSESTPEQEKAERAALFERAVQAYPFMQQSGVVVNLAELFKWTLEPYRTKTELDRFFQEAPPPPPEPQGASNVSAPNQDQAQSQVSAGSVNPNSLQG